MLKIIAMLLVVLAMAACSAPSSEASSSSQQAESQSSSLQGGGMANPVVDCAGPEDFAPLGFTIDAPQDAKDVRYSVISGEIAQVNFTAPDGAEYTYRASSVQEDISGVYDAFEDRQLSVNASYSDHDIALTVKTTTEGGRLAEWKWGDVNYSLFTPDKTEDDAVTSLCLSLAEAGYQP